MIELRLLNYRPLVTKFLLECESETLNVIGGGLGKSLWKGNEWWIGGGSIIQSLKSQGSVKLELFNWFCYTYFLILLLACDSMQNNLHSWVLISGSNCWPQACNCPLWVKGWLLYDSEKVYVPEHSLFFIAGFDGFQHILLLDTLFVCILESLPWFC